AFQRREHRVGEARHEPDPAHLAPAEPSGQGQDGDLQGHRHLAGHVVPRDARRPQRAADHGRRRPGRLRPRLPRGHLRHVRRHDQRRGARPPADDDVPAAHALVQGRRHDRRRAVAGEPLPGDQGPRGRPARAGPDHPVRWLHQRRDRNGSRGARDAGAQEGLRRRLRRRDLHRLRRLRGRLPERLLDAVHRREGHPPRPHAAGAARAQRPGGQHGRPAGPRGLRRLHQHRRVLARLPQGHLDGDHLPAQPRPARRPARGSTPQEL
ncbi:MAG: Succinate dehydrogenase iron-sulfur protein, partial [uncultured Blastococcus sp.]